MVCKLKRSIYGLMQVEKVKSFGFLNKILMTHWEVVKNILKYLRRTRDYMLVFHYEDLIPIGYIDFDF